jgi:hypothetical protein
LFSPVQPPRRGRLGGAASASATTTRATRLFGGSGPKAQQQQQQQGKEAAAVGAAAGAKTAPRLSAAAASLLTSPVQQGKAPAVPRFDTPERHRAAPGDAPASAELASPPLKVRKLSFDDCPDKASTAAAAAAAAGLPSNSSSSKARPSAAGGAVGKRLGGGLVFEPGEGVMAVSGGGVREAGACW